MQMMQTLKVPRAARNGRGAEEDTTTSKSFVVAIAIFSSF
jgi:hypothetical protein